MINQQHHVTESHSQNTLSGGNSSLSNELLLKKLPERYTRIIDEPHTLNLNGQDYILLHLSVGGGSFELFGERHDAEPRSVLALFLVERSEINDINFIEKATFEPYRETRPHMVARPAEPIHWIDDYTFDITWQVGGHFAVGEEKKSYFITTIGGSPVIREGVLAD